MNCKTLFLGCILICCYSCKQAEYNASESVLRFTRADFSETLYLNEPEEIIIDELLNPAIVKVMRDSILVVNNQPNCEYLLELYSLNTYKSLKQLITKGNGPSDMISCVLGLHGSEDKNFLLTDYNSGVCYIVNMDVLLRNIPFSPLSKFKISPEVSEKSNVCIVNDSSYVGYNRWYLPESRYNHVDSSLAYYRFESKSDKINSSPYYMGLVNGSGLLYSSGHNQIWEAEGHRDVIHIYNDSLQVVKSLMGPDQYVPKYLKEPLDPQNIVIRFANGCNYKTYCDYYMTPQHVYLVYVGTDAFDDTNMNPVEIFKLDYDGNLLCNYKLDRYVYSISLDSEEKNLYCLSRQSVMEPPVILKYHLK